MKLQLLLALATLHHAANAVDFNGCDNWSLTEMTQVTMAHGGNGGTAYNDISLVAPGQRMKSVTINSGDRINGVTFNIDLPSGSTIVLKHGGNGGSKKEISFRQDEYISSFVIQTGEKEGKTRIRYLQFVTSLNQTIEGGTLGDDPDNKLSQEDVPISYQVAGMHGNAGKEMDKLGFVYTRLDPQNCVGSKASS
ncbi:uncharacterized protein CCR75_001945 [Bremia lactucae]|uniref:Jacalin-type lectin domain-containing protein n=1 Tax=Bremia lactucae TaxID=4779 RepID=A0A976IH02_BRELC|nr:hypothetical protein CCR75_001945 [Bremia lactucae]